MISPTQVQALADEVTQRGLDDSTMAHLRQTYPDWHFTYCLDDDINQPEPVLSGEGFNVYLVGGGHCLALTRDYEAAGGVVFAAVTDEA
jgi:hypothetical protein